MTQDSGSAERERHARRRLAGAAHDLPRLPWLAPGQPPQDVDLVRHLLWRTNGGQGAPVPVEDVVSALALLPAAREELEQIEAALLFVARAEGLSWDRIAEATGLRSRQAAQQRWGPRVADRRDGTP